MWNQLRTTIKARQNTHNNTIITIDKKLNLLIDEVRQIKHSNMEYEWNFQH